MGWGQLYVSRQTFGFNPPVAVCMKAGMYVIEVKCAYALKDCSSMEEIVALVRQQSSHYLLETGAGLLTLNPKHAY